MSYEQTGYRCPACGLSATYVRSTTTYEVHITRKRQCHACGYVHETIEMNVDQMELMKFAHAVTCRIKDVDGEDVLDAQA